MIVTCSPQRSTRALKVIVTFNLHDFPLDPLDRYGIEAEHPDDYVLQLLDVDAPSVIAAVVEQSASLTKPPQTVSELLDALASRGVPKFARTVGDLMRRD